jgi:hypothetical protein
METHKDRRIDHRVPLGLTAVCHKVGQPPGRTYTAMSVNVSPGGMLMEVNTSDLKEGQLLSVEMSVPPTEGLLEFGGRFSTYARIVRVQSGEQDRPPARLAEPQKIALEFCRSMKLRQ